MQISRRTRTRGTKSKVQRPQKPLETVPIRNRLEKSEQQKEKMIQQVIEKIPLPEVPELPKTTGGVSPFKNMIWIED